MSDSAPAAATSPASAPPPAPAAEPAPAAASAALSAPRLAPPAAAVARPRQSWDEYFLSLAAAAASRSNCTRRKIGAVIARDRRVRATGYNGPPSGYGHCDSGACPRATTTSAMCTDYDNCVAIHAEANALLFAHPDERVGASLYTTAAPCFACAKLVANSGVVEVVAGGGRYESWEMTRRFLIACDVRVRILEGYGSATPLPLPI